MRILFQHEVKIMQGTRDRSADWLSSDAYEQLRRATATYREDLVIRLGAEVGLQPSEMSQLTPDNIHTHGAHYFVQFPTAERLAYLPSDVEHDIRKYTSSEGISSDEPVFDVTPRRLQMLIREVAARAGDVTGDEQLGSVSSRNLQDRYARSLLVERDIPLRVVQAVGGWESIERLQSYLDPIEMDTIVAAFDQSENDTSGRVAPVHRENGTSRLYWLTEIAADLGEELATASTQTGIQKVVCERLGATDDCRFAWAGDVVGDNRVIPQEHDGIESNAIEALLTQHGEQVSQAIGSGDVQVVAKTDATENTTDVATHVFVPIVTGDTVRGMCGIGIESSDFDTIERKLFAAIGVQIGHALGAVEHKRLLLADSVMELTIQCTDSEAFFSTASAALDCTFRLSGIVPIEGDSLLCFVVVTGSTPEAVLTFADDTSSVDRARLIRDHGDSALIECTVTDDPAVVVVERGGSISELISEKGQERLVSEVATDADTRSMIDSVTSEFPDSYLRAKREREKPVETKVGLRESLSELLTPKQESALRVAYLGGYFEWPRASTAEELAESMDISSPTLHNHLRNAQQKLLMAFFDDNDE
jgi:DNA-binding CsgD family transcriptional regulator